MIHPVFIQLIPEIRKTLDAAIKFHQNKKIKTMKQFINFTVKQFGKETPVSAHFSKIYKMDGIFFWEGFPITTHAAEIQKDINEEISRSEKVFSHEV